MGKIKLSLTPIIITYLICTCICIVKFGMVECLRVSGLCLIMSCLWVVIVATICISILYIKTTKSEIKENKNDNFKKGDKNESKNI